MAGKDQKRTPPDSQPGSGLAEQRAQDGCLVVRSLSTADGGCAGLYMEVAEAMAQQMISGGRAVLAKMAEAAQYRARIRREWMTAVPAEEQRYGSVPPAHSSGQKG